MADADYTGIYNQLNGGSQYTPLSAETFGDWSMEAGDIVTFVKDGRSYTTPIMHGDMVWDGAPKVVVESSGSRERESVGRMSRRKYSGGGGGYHNAKKMYTKFTQNDEMIEGIAYKIEKDETEYNTRITQLAKSIELEATERRQDGTELRGLIRVQANKISLIVDGNGNVNGASIIAAVNKDGSSVKIKADKIDIDGVVTASAVNTALGKITTASVRGLLVSYLASFDGYVNINGIGTVSGRLEFPSNGTLQFKGYNVSWKSKTVVTGVDTTSTSGGQYFALVNASNDIIGHKSGDIVTGVGTDTIYYLGR